MLKPLPTLRQLRYLTALAQHCHFGKAADACLATQSSVSAGLAELEALLDVTLLERSRRRVVMTPIGQRIADQAIHILAAAEELVEMARQSTSAPLSGTLHLGVIPTIAPYILPGLIPRLRRTYPDLRLHLREDLSAPLIERLDRGDLEAVILALPYATPGMTHVELGEDPFVVACLPDHPLAQKVEIRGGDLTHSDMVLLEEGHCLRDHSLSACALTPSDFHETVLATSLTTLVQMVASGLGITILPKLAVDHGLLSGTPLIVRPLTPPSGSRTLALCWRDPSARTQDFQLLAGQIMQCLT